MKRYFLTCVTILHISNFAIAQGTLLVPAGQTKIINATYRPALLDALVMEDNSKIQVTGIPEWRVHIVHMQIGSKARIELKGYKGKDANQTRVDNGNTADYCQGGKHSQDGGAGGSASSGPDLYILTGLQTIGDLTIDRQGENGGVGGPGGKGEKGGQARAWCRAGDGAQGGSGGSGGNGASHPKVEFLWYPLGSSTTSAGFDPGLKFVGDPGKGGIGGPGGPGGDPGDGCCSHGHGGVGGAGNHGANGRDGQTVDWVVRKIDQQMAPAIAAINFNPQDAKREDGVSTPIEEK